MHQYNHYYYRHGQVTEGRMWMVIKAVQDKLTRRTFSSFFTLIIVLNATFYASFYRVSL